MSGQFILEKVIEASVKLVPQSRVVPVDLCSQRAYSATMRLPCWMSPSRDAASRPRTGWSKFRRISRTKAE